MKRELRHEVIEEYAILFYDSLQEHGLVNREQAAAKIKHSLASQRLRLFDIGGLCTGYTLIPSPDEYFVGSYPGPIIPALSEILETVEQQLLASFPNLHSYRVDQDMFAGHILCRIVAKIQATLFSVFFLPKESNPNVYLETGVAFALGKPILLVKGDNNDLPSFLQGIDFAPIGLGLSLGVLSKHVETSTPAVENAYIVCSDTDHEDTDFLYSIQDALASLNYSLKVKHPLVDATGFYFLLDIIIQNIQTTRFGIYRIDGVSPIVFFALGVAIGLNRPWLLAARRMATVPSDLHGLSFYEFASFRELRHQIAERSRDFLIRYAGTPKQVKASSGMLRRLLVDYFGADELRTLSQDLGVDFEYLPGEGEEGKVRELILYLERRDRLEDLISEVNRRRPVSLAELLTFIQSQWSTLTQLAEKDDDDFVSYAGEMAKTLAEQLGLRLLPSTSFRINGLAGYLLDTSPLVLETRLASCLPMLFAAHQQLSDDALKDFRTIMSEKVRIQANIAVLILVGEDPHLEKFKRALISKAKHVYAYDFIVLGWKEIERMLVSADPQSSFRQLLISEIDLTSISTFVSVGPVPDNMFFGREGELREIVEHSTSASHAVIGGRRIGKSSLLIRLHHVRLPADGFRTIYHDCSTTSTYEAFFAAPIRDWRPEPPVDTVGTFGELLQSPPDDKSLVLLLDEADKLVPADRANGWPLFNALRALANSGQVQVVLSGERTLRDALRDSKSPLFNFANEMLLGPLDFHAVEELVTRPMKQLEIELVDEKAIVGRIWAFTSGHPNIVQRLCHRLIERLNEQGTRRITLEDVNAVIEDPGFQRDDFLSTYWEAATSLEKIISLLMADKEDVRTLRAVRQALADRCDLQPKAREVDDALQRLVDLRSILKRTPTGYEFAVEAFPRVVAGTMTLDDMLVILTEEYQEQGE